MRFWLWMPGSIFGTEGERERQAPFFELAQEKEEPVRRCSHSWCETRQKQRPQSAEPC